MSKLRIVLLAAVLVVSGCAGVKILVGKALEASEYIVENTIEFMENPGHQQAAFKLGETYLTANGGKISAVDIVRLCTPSGCHPIRGQEL